MMLLECAMIRLVKTLKKRGAKMKKGRIIVLGHKNPDVDSMISGYLLSSYLRYKKYDVEYVIPDEKIDEESRLIVEGCGIDTSNFSGTILEGSKLILVDHHETEFKNDVIAVIDHHPTIKTFEYPIYINEKASSTTKHIYDIVSKECPQYIGRRFIELVIIGMVVDTCSFRSSKSKPGDKEWVLDMCEKYGINIDEIMEIGDCITDIDDVNKASLHGYKGYNYFGKSIGTSYIQVREVDETKIDLILDILKEKVKQDSLRMWLFIVTNLTDVTTTVYKISRHEVEINQYDFMASRGSNIMPQIENEMCEENKWQ